MSKNKSNQQKLKEHTPEKSEKTASPPSGDNQNQNHNTKKVSLGPNTYR